MVNPLNIYIFATLMHECKRTAVYQLRLSSLQLGQAQQAESMMDSFQNDFRFARPPDSGSGGHDEDDEPLFGGDESFMDNQQHAGPSSWRKRFRPEFGEANGAFHDLPNGHAAHEDAAFDESFTVGPSRDENTELYAILNLDKDATTQDVLRSYRSLAVSFQYAVY